MSLASSFWDVLNKTDTCWIWTRAVDTRGYGHLSVRGKMMRAHRYAFELVYGESLGARHVMHICDNKLCCNPSHLISGTYADNMADMRRKGRRKGICAREENGRAKLTEFQVEEIRSDQRSSRAVAKVYGISKAQVLRIRSFKQWTKSPQIGL